MGDESNKAKIARYETLADSVEKAADDGSILLLFGVAEERALVTAKRAETAHLGASRLSFKQCAEIVVRQLLQDARAAAAQEVGKT